MSIFRVWQLVDQFLGSFVCFLFMIVRSVGVRLGLLPFPQYPKSIDKILFIKMVGFGTIILSTPAINSIRKRYPDVKTYILTLEQNRPVVELMDEFDEIITIDHSAGIIPAFIQCFETVFLVRKIGFDLILDLEIFSNMSAIFVFLCGNVFSAGFASFNIYRDVFYNSTVAFDHSQHIMDIYLKTAGILGVDVQEKEITRFSRLPKEAKGCAQRFLTEAGISGAPIVFVNINAGELTLLRRFPLDKMTRVLSQIVARKPAVFFVFIGSPREKDFVDEFLRALPSSVLEHSHNVAGKVNITELLSLYTFGHVYLGNDSGPLHLAAAMKLPVVAFFGPETPNLYGYNSHPNKMFYTNYFCSPCLNSYNFKHSKCKKNVCLEGIIEEDVTDAVVDILDQPKAGGAVVS